MTSLLPMRWFGGTLLLVTALVCAAPARAQQMPTPVQPVAQAADTTDPLISPRTALFRSLLIPGWGQASVGAFKRGGIFFGVQSASWYMLLRTMARLGDAEDIRDRRIAFVSDTLRARMAVDSVLAEQLADPIRFQQRVDSAATVIASRNLVNARRQQRQDWVTYTIFFMFASGVDAYIAAQLADFPATIVTRPPPTGGVQLQLNVPLPHKP